MASTFKSSDRDLRNFQNDRNTKMHKALPKTRFPKFREMINHYKRINGLTRYLIHIIVLIIVAGILVAAYEVFI